jgi:malate/lactate dehydrogenase
MSSAAYEVRVVGSLGPAGIEAFTDVSVDVEPTATVLSADLEQSDLHMLLDRVRNLGLELIDVRRTE